MYSFADKKFYHAMNNKVTSTVGPRGFERVALKSDLES